MKFNIKHLSTMNVERAFRIVNEASWGKLFIKNATEYHGALEKFKINVAKFAPENFIKAAFILGYTPEGADFWEQVNKDFISVYNDKTCRVFRTVPVESIVAKLYMNGVITNLDEFQLLLKKEGIQYDGITKIYNEVTGKLIRFEAYKQSSKIEEELP